MRVFREEGFPSLYRGIGPLLLRSVAATASQFTTYRHAAPDPMLVSTTLRGRCGVVG